MRILVTGGAGFIGSHIVDRLFDLGHVVSVVDNLSTGRYENLNDSVAFHEVGIEDPALEKVFEEGQFDLVCHQAANVSVAISVREPMLDARYNIMGPLNMLQLAVKYGVKKVVFASSGGVAYGDAPEWPAHEGLHFAPISPYGITKCAFEWYLQFFAHQHGLKYTALRYSNVYGPRQDPHGEAGVVAIFSQLMLANKQPRINGDGQHVRDYVFVKDVVEANIAALDGGDNDAFNVGTGVETTVEGLYLAIKNATGYTGDAHYGPPRDGDLRRNVLSYAKINDALGWEPKHSLESGLAETVEWFKSR